MNVTLKFKTYRSDFGFISTDSPIWSFHILFGHEIRTFLYENCGDRIRRAKKTAAPLIWNFEIVFGQLVLWIVCA